MCTQPEFFLLYHFVGSYRPRCVRKHNGLARYFMNKRRLALPTFNALNRERDKKLSSSSSDTYGSEDDVLTKITSNTDVQASLSDGTHLDILLLHHRLLHLPAYTYGHHFDSYTFFPLIYGTFLHRIEHPSPQNSAYLSEMRRSDVPTSNMPPSMTYHSVPSQDRTPVVVDSGATFGTTPFLDDLLLVHNVQPGFKWRN